MFSTFHGVMNFFLILLIQNKNQEFGFSFKIHLPIGTININ